MQATRIVIIFLIVLGLSSPLARAVEADANVVLDIPAQSLAAALRQLAEQTGLQLVYETDLVTGHDSPAIRGSLTPREAIEHLLRGTGLKYEFLDERTVAVSESRAGSTTAREPMQGAPARRLAQAEAGAQTAGSLSSDERARKPEEASGRIPEILVVGSKILNMDITRTESDPQPYVIFHRKQIEQSGAATIEGFLKQRLPMNTQGLSNNQFPGFRGTVSQVNLRGLGTHQTLILVDGHRIAANAAGATSNQPDISGIPLAAVERIEVLPTTASGIYGGSATGGVVNIILRRDYAGVESRLTYDNTFDTDSAIRRIDLAAGFTLEGGKTRVLLAGSYADQNELLTQDRDFARRGREAILANRPADLLPPATPPLGATANLRSVDGSPLFGPGTPSFTSVPVGYAGGGGLAPLQESAGRYNLDLANSAQFGGGRSSLLSGPTIESLQATLRREFGSAVQVFLDAAASNSNGRSLSNGLRTTFALDADAPNNPFGQAVLVTVPNAAGDSYVQVRNRDRRVVGGVIVQLPRKWKVEADYTWSQSSTRFRGALAAPPGVLAAMADGTLDVLRDLDAFPLDLSSSLQPSQAMLSPERSTLRDVTVRLAGPLGRLPAGPIELSTLLEHRQERIDESLLVDSTSTMTLFPSRSQEVDSIYLEARLPLLANRDRANDEPELELQVAGRHDDYTIDGVTASVPADAEASIMRARSTINSTNPTVGLSYRPLPDLMLRASYGTGFLPPSVTQVTPSTPLPNVTGDVDPRRGNTPAGPYLLRRGGNPDMEPEESESWSVGAVFTPRFSPELRLSLDYTRIEKMDNIATLLSQQIIDNESLFPDRVIRGPVPPGDPFGVGPIIEVDTTSVNISQAKVEAYDVQLDYRKETMSAGAFEFFAVATWQTHYETQLLAGQPIIESVGVSISNPLKLKVNGGVTWTYGDWTLGWNTRYFDSYLVFNHPIFIENQGSDGIVPSQIYHDVVVTRRLSSSSQLLDGLEVQLGVKNVFDEEPPFDAIGISHYSAFGDPRLASYYISLRKAF